MAIIETDLLHLFKVETGSLDGVGALGVPVALAGRCDGVAVGDGQRRGRVADGRRRLAQSAFVLVMENSLAIQSTHRTRSLFHMFQIGFRPYYEREAHPRKRAER